MAHYSAVSAEVHRIFNAFTPDVELVALAEAFLDVTGRAHLFGGPQALGLEPKRRVRAEVDLAFSVGIAPSKLVAKIACTLSKPDGFAVVTPGAVRALLDPLPIRRLWGIGPVLGADLEKLGIQTIQDLRTFDLTAVQRDVGPRALSLQASPVARTAVPWNPIASPPPRLTPPRPSHIEIPRPQSETPPDDGLYSTPAGPWRHSCTPRPAIRARTRTESDSSP